MAVDHLYCGIFVDQVCSAVHAHPGYGMGPRPHHSSVDRDGDRRWRDREQSPRMVDRAHASSWNDRGSDDQLRTSFGPDVLAEWEIRSPDAYYWQFAANDPKPLAKLERYVIARRALRVRLERDSAAEHLRGASAHTFSNGTSILLCFSSHGGTGRFFERMNSGLNSFD